MVNLFKVQNVVDLSAEPTRLIAHHVLESEFCRSLTQVQLLQRKVAKHVQIISVKVGQSSHGGRWVAGPHKPQNEAQRMLLKGVPKKLTDGMLLEQRCTG